MCVYRGEGGSVQYTGARLHNTHATRQWSVWSENQSEQRAHSPLRTHCAKNGRCKARLRVCVTIMGRMPIYVMPSARATVCAIVSTLCISLCAHHSTRI